MTAARGALAPAAMVLAAGLGTRLRPLTEHVPKPLAWLGDRPQIDHALAAVARGGFTRAVVNTHHLAERFDEAWRAAQPVDVELSHEATILGTAGGVENAAARLGAGDVLVVNADIVATVDLAALVAAHGASGAAATLLVAPARGAGTVGIDARGDVVRLRAHRGAGETAQGDYAGMLVLGAALRERLPKEGCLVGDVLMPALARGERVATHALPTGFADTGTVAEYLAANLAWLDARGEESFVHPTARVARGVVLDRVVVAPGAVIEGEGVLADAVVWPGARVVAPDARAVFAPFGVVRP